LILVENGEMEILKKMLLKLEIPEKVLLDADVS
jgi:hypothetical protein